MNTKSYTDATLALCAEIIDRIQTARESNEWLLQARTEAETEARLRKGFTLTSMKGGV